ncbi:hypothetical protein [Roseateles sp.]|uniref:hypothetical protein n=1 Tax=Roseateles sp. TaxID=1971397 RepID=UPI002E02AFCF|nr:hypothetical protein [Roseateles sp.]
MDTRLLDGVAPLACDADIAAFFQDEDDPFGGGIEDSRIGVLNDAGQLYRIMTTAGMGEYVRLCKWLESLGLRNLRPMNSTANIVRDGISFDDLFTPG